MAIVIVAEQYDREIKESVYEFNENSEIDNLLFYATEGWAFRIPHEEDRKLWNSLIDEGWTGLDDSDYFRYNKPIVHNNKWMTENDGYFLSIQEMINDYENSIKFLMEVKNLYGGQY